MRILRCNRTGAFTCLASCWHDHINVAVQNQAPRSLFGACWGDVGECAFGSGRIFVMNTRSFSIEECPVNTSNLTEVLAVEFGGVLAWGHPGYLAETTARCKSSSDRGSARFRRRQGSNITLEQFRVSALQRVIFFSPCVLRAAFHRILHFARAWFHKA